jgi:hypothetical protein
LLRGRTGTIVFGNLDPHFVADFDIVEPVVHDRVPVEIDIAGRRFDKPVAFIGEQAHHLAMRRDFMGLDLVAPNAGVVLELAARRVEGIADRHVNVAVRRVFAAGLVHLNGLSRDTDVDRNLVEAAFALVLVGRFDRHVAPDDVRLELFKFFSVFHDTGFYRVGMVEITEGDFDWYWHF